MIGAHRRRLAPQIPDLGDDLRQLECAFYLGCEPVDDRPRRAGGRKQALPPAHGKAVEGLADGRQIRRRRDALGGGDGDRPHCAGLRLLPQRGHAVDREVDMAAEHVVQLVGSAAERHMRHLGAARELEHHGGEVRRRPDAGRAVVHLALIRLEIADHLGHRLRRHRVVHHQQVGQMHQQRDRLEVALGVVGELAVKELVDHVGAERGEQQRVAVIGAFRDVGGTDAAARARAVLHHHGNAELRLQMLLNDPPKKVGGTAGGERHHEGHRALRPILRLRRGRGCKRSADDQDGGDRKNRRNASCAHITHPRPPGFCAQVSSACEPRLDQANQMPCNRRCEPLITPP